MKWNPYREKVSLRRAMLHESIAQINNEIAKLDSLLEIPENATLRLEYVRCGNDACGKGTHGPYCYAYWKEQGKLKKRYLGTGILQALDPTEMDDSMSAAIEDSYNERMYRYTSRPSKTVPKFLQYGFNDIDWESLEGRKG